MSTVEERLHNLELLVEDMMKYQEEMFVKLDDRLTQIQFITQSINETQSYEISNNTQMKEVMSNFVKVVQSNTDTPKKSVKKPKPPKHIDTIKASSANPNGPKSVYVNMCKDISISFSDEIAILAHKLYDTYEASREYTDYLDIYDKVFNPKLDENTIPSEFFPLRDQYLQKYNELNNVDEAEEEPQEEEKVVKKKPATRK